MMQLGILIMTTYFTHFAASSGPRLSVMQDPEDASVLLSSSVWMLCVFEYPSEENEEPVVYWKKDPDCHNEQSLQSSPSTGGPQLQITKNILRGFSILKLSNVDQNTSNSYFCDVMLTEKIQGKGGNGTKLTVHVCQKTYSKFTQQCEKVHTEVGICGSRVFFPFDDLKYKDRTSDKIWWGWSLLLGCTIFVTAVITAFGIQQCHTKCKNKLRNKDISTTMQRMDLQLAIKTVNNGFRQEYEDMSVIRTLCDTGREMIRKRKCAQL